MIKQQIEDVIKRTPSSISSNPLSAVFILIALAVIYTANRFPEKGLVGPELFPTLISVGIIVFAAADILSETQTEQELTDLNFRPPAVVIGLLMLYVSLMPVTGFLLGSMLLLLVLLHYSNVRSTTLLIALSVGFPILLFYLFGRIFLIRLPEGIVPISRLLPQLPLGVVV
ncbi:tripartite tricarboxylate transporter TctB family protein [Halocatena pleomorpha]|uniref:Tripartite tricarboxylate transporter TctB family protein n=1 Tax=Halocatena pleomorpha TaxID=1785090 RepID=A0A3P3R7W4_9EURY|nr:tripartite tricarboxylate transporter TctB family protein [Halocatena pleomorpha]RRJ29516.1 tripartite tricarboxylate transporter TctB family protein [Halocatena pleomorpha]